MFAFLRGAVALKPPGAIALDVNGVGYFVHVPESVHRTLRTGAEATLLTYCYIREDQFTIFGFLREEEKAVFQLLLGISGIGPKVALAVLSSLGVRGLAKAVSESDVSAFNKVPGVGKKTAQRIVLEMKTRMGQDAELSEILGEAETEAAPADDVVEALCALGCTLAEAKKAASAARSELGSEARDEDYVRAALRSLAK